MKLLDGFMFLLPHKLVQFFTLWGGGGDGGGGSQTSTSYSTNLPEYAKPYYEELLKQTGKQVYTTDAKGNVTGVQGMPTYTGERIAGFTPEQLKVQSDVAGMTTPGGFGAASSGLGMGQTMGFGAGAAGLGQAFGYTPWLFQVEHLMPLQLNITCLLINLMLQTLQFVKQDVKVILKDLVVQWELLVVEHLVALVKL
jgi:hypothetical protein